MTEDEQLTQRLVEAAQIDKAWREQVTTEIHEKAIRSDDDSD